VKAPFLSFRDFCIRAYGGPVYRVAVDAGFTCPNRSADGSGGCAFCDETGARSPVARSAGIEDQVREGIGFARGRYGAERFMAYLQAFSGTNAGRDERRAVYDLVLGAFPFTAFSVATRPDCLGPDAVEDLAELKERADIWVELGVQTAHDRTLAAISRGHDWACSRRAIERAAAAGLRVAVHVIVGLPGETRDDWVATAEALSPLPVSGIKIHNLHILRGTALAGLYGKAPFHLPDEAGHAEAVIEFIRRMPPDAAIMRINTDTAPDRLIAPRWRLSKGQFRDRVIRLMNERGVRQGDLRGGGGG